MKPSRRDLLVAIHKLQDLVSFASMAHGNDRNPHGFEQGQRALKEAECLCHKILAFDPPMDGKRSRFV